MARDQNSLWHLASSVEEILDIQLADARSRSKYRRETLEKLDDILTRINKRAPDAEPTEGLHLSPKTLKDGLKELARWLLPLLVAGLPHLFPHLLK